MWAFWGQEPYLFFFVSQYLAEANNKKKKNAEWINDNYLLKATIELSNHLKDLEVKLPIWLGFEIKITVISKATRFRWSEKAASACREAWCPATLGPLCWDPFYLERGSLCGADLSVVSLSPHRSGQSADCSALRAGVGQRGEQRGLGSSSCLFLKAIRSLLCKTE